MFTSLAPYLTTVTEPPNTKKAFKIKENAKQKNRPRIISVVRATSIAGRTMDVTIITC